jgi:WD40 repeat protein
MLVACATCHHLIAVGDNKPEEVHCPACGSSFRLCDTAHTTTAAEARTLGRFQLLECVGRGAFGAVWKARDTELDRVVALKLLHSGRASTEAERERFFREARAAAQLRHPGIVTVHEVLELDAAPAIVSEFVEGVTLRELLQVRRPTFREAAELTAQVAEALDYAHSLRVVHRDVKPGNIMLEPARGESVEGAPERTDASGNASGAGSASGSRAGPRALLLDFGLALRDEAEVTMTLEGQVIGTPTYMSPEQAAGHSHRVDRRSDIYSLGVVLYELLCGEVPFRGSKGMLIQQVLHEEPRPPRRVNDKVPCDLETICLKAMAKETARRYATARELAEDLRRFLRGDVIQARPVGAWERAGKWVKRHPAAAGLLAVSAVAILALVGVAVGSVYSVRLAAAYQETEGARRVAEQAQAAEAEQRQKAEQFLYFSRVGLAEREWSANNVGRALRLLDECPPARRGWEWDFLEHLCHTEIRTLPAHEQQVSSVAWSPDGQRLASGSFDQTIKIWDAQTGQQLCRLTCPYPVYCVRFSPDGQWLASGDYTFDPEAPADVRVWEVATGREHRTLKGCASMAVYCVAFDPSGRRLAAACYDKAVRVWDLGDGRIIHTFQNGPDSCGSVAFSPDGHLLAAATGDLDVFSASPRPGQVIIWDAETGKEQAVLPGHCGPVSCVAFSPNGGQVASASMDQTVKLWDVQTRKETRTLRGHGHYVSSVDFSGDGDLLASGSIDGSIKVWEPRTGALLRTLRGHTGQVTWLAFSRRGRRLASAGADRTVKIWDPTLDPQPRSLRISAKFATSVAFDPEGKRLAAACADGTMKVLNPDTGEELQSLHGHNPKVWRLVFSPDGHRLASASEDKTAKVWDAASGKELLTLEGHGKWVQNVAFSHDGRRLATASGDRMVKLWDATTGRELGPPLTGHTGRVWSVAFSPDDTRIASGAGDRTVRVWDTGTGAEVLPPLRGHDDEVTFVEFNPQRKQLASAAEDGTVRLWDATTGKELLVLRGHAGDVYGLAFSPDGHRLASASQDGTVKIWETAAGQELLTLRADTGGFHSVTFSPDGRHIAAAGYDGTVRIWDATPQGE